MKMTIVEKLSNDLYETLLQLRYPGLAQTTSRDIRETVLASENRLILLSWLLGQSSIVKPEEFSTRTDESKIIKWYSNMGICDNPDALMGRVPLQDQVFALKNLLLFVRNVLSTNQSKGDFNDQSQVNDIFKKRMSENVNIIPPNCNLTSKFTYNEAVQYLNNRRESLSQKKICIEKSSSAMKNDLSPNKVFGSMENNSASSNESDRRECIDKFLRAFATVSSWPKSTDSESKSMDNFIDDIHSNMATVTERLHSKHEVSSFVLMKKLEKRVMPLDAPIEDIVIAIEEVGRLQIIE